MPGDGDAGDGVVDRAALWDDVGRRAVALEFDSARLDAEAALFDVADVPHYGSEPPHEGVDTAGRTVGCGVVVGLLCCALVVLAANSLLDFGL